MPVKQDRRVTRSRAQLHSSLLHLITERPYGLITIQEIADQANVSRATFYLHFSDKNALFESSLQEKMLRLIEQFMSKDFFSMLNSNEGNVILFEEIANDHVFYTTLFCSEETSVLRPKVQKIYSAAVERLINETMEDAQRARLKVPVELLSGFIAHGTIAMVEWWLENDMSVSAEYMAQISQQFYLFGAMPFLMGSAGPNL